MNPTIAASKHISALLNIAHIAIELVQAQNAIVSAKAAYYDRLASFRGDFLRSDFPREERIDPCCPESAEIIAFSKEAFDAYKAAKRKAYNTQRRLHTACKKLAEVAA